jgi:hypothetical protein
LTAKLPPDESAEPKLDLIGAVPDLEANPIDFHRFSNWHRLIRCVAYVLKFLALKIGKKEKLMVKIPEIKGITTQGNLENIDLEMAKLLILKIVQREIPPDGTYLSIDGLLRAKSRLGQSTAPLDFKNPIILPRAAWVTTLIIRDIHQKLMHFGSDATLNQFFMNYWCKNARKLVKREIKNCPKCIKDRAIRFSLPSMPNLPKTRVEFSPAFSNIGLDYLGPSLYKRPNEPPGNVWIILFTCLCCRAVHLEPVQTLEANDFLLAFRRFVARRGLPREILSDNGSQLVLARKALLEANIPTNWSLITALAPWQGGVYERLVALVKQCCRRSLGHKMLNWVELGTFITEVEGVINSRPLTYVDEGGQTALRPIDFLIPKINLFLENEIEKGEIFRPTPAQKLAQRWKATTAAIENFKERWTNEYLIMLRGKNNTKHKGPRLETYLTPKIGQIVLIQEEFNPKNIWPMGKIVELKGPKNHARSASILMPNGRIWNRPVNLLAPLEVPPGDENQKEPTEIEPIVEPTIDPPPMIDGQPELAIEPLEPEINPPLTIEQPESIEEEPIHRTRARTGNLKPNKRFGDQWMVGINFTVLLLIFSLILPLTTAENPALICKKEGVEFFATMETKNVQICCEGICGSRTYKTPFLWELPEENLIIGYDCEGTYWEGTNQSANLKSTCPPINICELITCSICWHQILNPTCFPTLSSILMGGLILIGVIFILIIYCALTCFCRCASPIRCCFWFCRKWKRRMPNLSSRKRTRRHRIEPSESENEVFLSENENISNQLKYKKWEKAKKKWGNSPFSKLEWALALVALCLPFAYCSIDTISLTSATEECEIGTENTTCIFNWVSQITLLPAGQLSQLILKDPQSNFAGILSMRLNGVTQKCLPENLGWLRSYKIETLSTKRCPGMGSCKGNFCKDLLPNGTIQEFHEGNDRPGNSFCMESTGFWFNGCGSPYAACLLYRNYLVPTSRPVFEYFHCPSWEFFVNTEISLELPGREIIKDRIELFNGFTFNWKEANLSLTPIITGRPATPILGSKFLVNSRNNEAAIVPELKTDLFCPTEVDADYLLKDCKLSLEACPICRPDHDSGTIRCHCRELNLEGYFENPWAKLPQPQGHLNILYEEGEILARTPYIPVIITAKMNGMRIVSQNIKAKCQIEPLSLVGCYKCNTGGRFDYKCTASYGNPLAEVNCENKLTFFARCSANGTIDHAILSLSQSAINMQCEVKCRAEITKFKLEGKLNYVIKKK